MLFFVTRLTLVIILQSSVSFVSDSVLIKFAVKQMSQGVLEWTVCSADIYLIVFVFFGAVRELTDALMTARLLLAASLSLWDT